MTTVAFVTYKYNGQDRRIGPLGGEPAESMAREIARRPGSTEVKVETWICGSVKDVVVE